MKSEHFSFKLENKDIINKLGVLMYHGSVTKFISIDDSFANPIEWDMYGTLI